MSSCALVSPPWRRGHRFTLLGALSVLGGLVFVANDARAQAAPAAPPAAPAPTTPAPPVAAPPTAAPVAPAAPVPSPSTEPSAGAPAEGTEPATTEAEPPPAEAEASSGSESAATDTGSGLFESSLSGSDDAGSVAGGGGATGIDLGGYVRGDVFAGMVPDSKRYEMKAAYGELALKVTAKKEHLGTAFAEARFMYGRVGDDVGPTINLREAYVSTYLGPLDLRLGQQIVVWGRADAFNPTNNLTPFDLRVRSPAEDDRQQGNVGARASLNLSPIRIEGVWMPLYRPAQIPFIVPWYARLVDDTPEPDLAHGTQGARVHLELPAFEMSASYVYGYAPLPGFTYHHLIHASDEPSETAARPWQLEIGRTPYQHHVVGFDFSTAIGDVLGLRGEAAYRFPMHFRTRYWEPRPDLQYVVGVDHNFGSVSVIAQYMGRVAFHWSKVEKPELPAIVNGDLDTFLTNEILPTFAAADIAAYAPDDLAFRNQMLFGQLHEVQHLASLRVEWLTLHDTLSLSALGMVNFTTQEWLAFPKVLYHLTDALSTSVGAEIYAGPTGTLFGLIDEELSAVYGELRASF